MSTPINWWKHPAKIQRNAFIYKSLSSWAYNVAVGCEHACRFCYVPSASTIKMGASLKKFGVDDPDAQWGDYVLVRPFREEVFLRSLAEAEKIPPHLLNSDGNRAVLLCSTTDPYQVVRHPDCTMRQELQDGLTRSVREGMRLIRDRSTLNVRILTRSPLARKDFEIMKSLGKRLLFGMSIPTLNNRLAKIYEPKAPAPTVRLATLKAAKEAGIPIYVAMAPTYPDCDKNDLYETLRALKELNPLTIFHEPINIRSENVERIEAHAEAIGETVTTDVFESPAKWAHYAFCQLMEVEYLANELYIGDRLHLWPDASLRRYNLSMRISDEWLNKWWSRVSEWPA